MIQKYLDELEDAVNFVLDHIYKSICDYSEMIGKKRFQLQILELLRKSEQSPRDHMLAVFAALIELVRLIGSLFFKRNRNSVVTLWCDKAICLILWTCGDIETNPGPTRSQTEIASMRELIPKLIKIFHSIPVNKYVKGLYTKYGLPQFPGELKDPNNNKKEMNTEKLERMFRGVVEYLLANGKVIPEDIQSEVKALEEFDKEKLDKLKSVRINRNKILQCFKNLTALDGDGIDIALNVYEEVCSLIFTAAAAENQKFAEKQGGIQDSCNKEQDDHKGETKQKKEQKSKSKSLGKRKMDTGPPVGNEKKRKSGLGEDDKCCNSQPSKLATMDAEPLLPIKNIDSGVSALPPSPNGFDIAGGSKHPTVPQHSESPASTTTVSSHPESNKEPVNGPLINSNELILNGDSALGQQIPIDLIGILSDKQLSPIFTDDRDFNLLKYINSDT